MINLAYIAGEGIDYIWDDSEVHAVVKLIKNGAMIPDLIEETDRDVIEILILLDDLVNQKRIKRKPMIRLLR